MDDDDAMIVIIVSEESEENQAIKEEPVDAFENCDLNPESILKTAELHGEYISLIKEEYDCENLKIDRKVKVKPIVKLI